MQPVTMETNIHTFCVFLEETRALTAKAKKDLF